MEAKSALGSDGARKAAPLSAVLFAKFELLQLIADSSDHDSSRAAPLWRFGKGSVKTDTTLGHSSRSNCLWHFTSFSIRYPAVRIESASCFSSAATISRD